MTSATAAPQRLQPLLRPLNVRGLRLENRFVMAPMTREKSPDRVPGPDVAAYYRRRAERQVGLIVTEGVAIEERAAVDLPEVPALFGEAALAGWKRVVEEVHSAGGKIFPQLWHQGVLRDPGVSRFPDAPSRGPSGILGPIGLISLDPEAVARMDVRSAPLSESEIGDLIAHYAKSASAAVGLGFDGIAVHGAHGYLPDAFMWHGTNKRSDRWGGSLEERATFPAEVVRAIRREVGPEAPILLRISQFKLQDYRAKLVESPHELEQLLGPIADAGCDIFDGSQRFFDAPVFEGSPLNLGGWAKKVTGKLGMAVGGVGLDKGKRGQPVDTGSAAADNLDRVVARFERDELDLIGVGRSLLNDPDWVRKAIVGEPFQPFDDANLTRLT